MPPLRRKPSACWMAAACIWRSRPQRAVSGDRARHWSSRSPRIGHALERRGLVERDLENAWLSADTEAGPLDDLLGYSITYRIAMGPRAGQKLFTLQTVPPRPQGLEGEPDGAARAGGFSLRAGMDIAQGISAETPHRDLGAPGTVEALFALQQQWPGMLMGAGQPGEAAVGRHGHADGPAVDALPQPA